MDTWHCLAHLLWDVVFRHCCLIHQFLLSLLVNTALPLRNSHWWELSLPHYQPYKRACGSSSLLPVVLQWNANLSPFICSSLSLMFT